MRHIFIVSSLAGAVRPGSVKRLISSYFPEQRHSLLLDPTDRQIDLLCRAYSPEELRLIAVGGDGTIHRLLTAAVQYDIPIGILPCGTANDLARAIELKRNLRDCCDVIQADHTRAIDLITVNGKLFATCGGLGLPSSVAIRHNCYPKEKPRLSAGRFRKVEYLLTALRALGRNHSVKVRFYDNRPRWSGSAAAVVISNQARFGGLFSVSPGAVNNDGIFDLCVIPDSASRFRELRMLFRAILGKEKIGTGVIHSRLGRTRILTDRVVPFFGDGEILSRDREFRIQILPRALRLIVPESAYAEEVQSRFLSPEVFQPGIWQSERYFSGENVSVRPQGKQDKSVGLIKNNTVSNPGQNAFT